MSWVLRRNLSDCDDSELVALVEQLSFLTDGGYQFVDEGAREEHQARLGAVLDAIDARLGQLHLFERLDALS